MMSVKICGITCFEDAQIAIECGASAIGLIFFKASPRGISFKDASKWICKISGQVKIVGVFVNEEIGNVKAISSELGLDYVQLHGDESPKYCSQINKPVIKVFTVDNYVDNCEVDKYKVDAFLFDTYREDMRGGTGKSFEWRSMKGLKTDIPIILSGGLNAGNVIEAVKVVNPSALDVNSGVELRPGKKDKRKLVQLFSILSKVDNQSNNIFR